MITWRSAGYVFLIGLVYIALVLFSIDLLLILLLLLLLLPLLSAIQLLIAKSSLQVGQELDPAIAERGDPVLLVVQLHQNGWLSHGELGIVVQKPGRRNLPLFTRKNIALAGGTTAEVSFPMEIPHRGVYPAGLRRIESRDLLGLFRLTMLKKKRCQIDLLQMTILPKPTRISGFETIMARLSGINERQAPKIGDEINDLANLRGRHPGESLKRVHWKISARLDEIMIKEFENPDRREGLVILDMARPETGNSKKHDFTDLADFYTDHAAFLVKQLLDSQICSKVVCYQADGRLENKADHTDDFRFVQLTLAGMNWTNEWPAELVLDEETGISDSYWFVLLLATRLNETTARRLAELQAGGLPAFLVYLQDQPEDSEIHKNCMKILADGDITSLFLYRLSGENQTQDEQQIQDDQHDRH